MNMKSGVADDLVHFEVVCIEEITDCCSFGLLLPS